MQADGTSGETQQEVAEVLLNMNSKELWVCAFVVVDTSV